MANPAPETVPGRGLSRRSVEPLWKQLLADLRGRLDVGEFVDAFPGELELRDEYGVSRHTVREALRHLRDEGVVVAARGRQPHVAAEAEIEQPLGALYSLFASVEAAGLEQRSVVRSLDVRADAHVAVRLGLEESTPLLHLERLRFAGSEPLAHDRVWLPAELARPLLDVDFRHTALYDELASRCQVRLTGGQERLRAVVPTAPQRKLLEIGADVAAFEIQRLGCASSRPVEWRTTLIRGDRFSALAEFSARTGYRLDLSSTVGSSRRFDANPAGGVDPSAQTVTTDSGRVLHYDYLVLAPGIQLDFENVSGLTETLGQRGVSSNYRFDLAPRTWEFIRDLRGGTALFTMPAGPIKCAGAPQKIAYLAADWWRSQGVLDRTRVILVLPTGAMFSQPDWAKVLEGIAAGYGIEVRKECQLVEVDGDNKRAIISDTKAGTKEAIDYDFLHATPPQSAPDWIKATPLADPASPFGYVQVDKHTLQNANWKNVFALGDAANLPTSKTGAAIRKQAPVLVANLLATMHGQTLSGHYDGYTSCPLVTSRNRMLLAEFDYDLKRTPTIPLINTLKPRYDMWLLKRYGLPAIYWNLMLKGRT